MEKYSDMENILLSNFFEDIYKKWDIIKNVLNNVIIDFVYIIKCF